MVQRATIDAIRDRADLVEVVSQVVTLKRKGNTWLGLCPFHQEKSPSFNVVPHKGIYHCFGCGEGGDVFRFVQKTRGISFMEAVRELGLGVGVEVEERNLSPEEQRRQRERATLYDVCEAAARFFQATLLTRPAGRPAREYLAGRGLKQATIESFRLGFAPDSWDALLNHLHREGIDADLAVAAGLARPRDEGRGGRRGGAYDFFRGRVIVPIQDARGRVVAFGGRILAGDGPKYVNSTETEIYQKSKTLYALSSARNAIQRRDRVIVVEGYFDVISVHQAGFTEAVATCGTALTEDHLETLRRLTGTAIAQFDTDAAGVRAAVKSIGMFLKAGIEPRRMDLSGAKDPDEFIQQHGATAFENLLERSEPLFNLVVRDVAARNGATPVGRQRALEELAPLLRDFPPAARDRAIGEVSGSLTLAENVTREAVNRVLTSEPAAPAPPPGPRWTGNRDLNHLLWLLIHHPSRVGPVFTELNPEPDSVSDRSSALTAVALLAAGTSLTDALTQIDDPDLHRLLLQAAAREGLYAEDRAAGAARQILTRMALRRLEEELAGVGRQLEACQAASNGSNYSDLLRRRGDLQKKKKFIEQSYPSRAGL